MVAGHGTATSVPATLSAALPPGSDVTSRTALAAATVGGPAVRRTAAGAARHGRGGRAAGHHGFWVSIAANVRQRRAENALLAALGVGQRSAAAQLFLEKLLLSVPSAALGLVLGTSSPGCSCPRSRSTRRRRQPVPPPVTLFDLPQTVPLAAVHRRACPRWPPRSSSSAARTRPPNCAPRRRHEDARAAPPGAPAWARHPALALAVLVFGCVFAATAGPREALATRTQALRQTLAATSPLAQTITVTVDMDRPQRRLGINSTTLARRTTVNLTAAQLGEITSQLRDDFDRGLVHLAPPGTDWSAMTSRPHNVMSNLGAARQGCPGQARGHVPAAVPPAHAAGGRPLPGNRHIPPSGRPHSCRCVQVVCHSQTAVDFGLHVGSKVEIDGPQIFTPGALAHDHPPSHGDRGPADPASSFWASDPTASTPDLELAANQEPCWVGGVFVGPGELGAIQADFGPEGWLCSGSSRSRSAATQRAAGAAAVRRAEHSSARRRRRWPGTSRPRAAR